MNAPLYNNVNQPIHATADTTDQEARELLEART